MLKLVFVCFAVVVLAAGACAAETLTYPDLVKRLTDLERLSVLPAQGENCALASSYDRNSSYDAKTGRYLNWDANRDGDGGGLLPREGNLYVLANIQGPGCIWRMWSASPKDGRVKIYLDGAAEPAVDLPFKNYFDGKTSPFNFPSLVYWASGGLDNYVPIPFQKSCKILAEKDWGEFFHFNYATYPKDTVIPTFKMQLSPEELAALAAADKALGAGLGSDPAGPRRGEKIVHTAASVEPGKATVVARLKGPAAITALRVKGIDDRDALRSIALRITWDNDRTPGVWCPLGDFFGTGPGVNKYKSLPTGMTDDGFYSYWYMPYDKTAVVELVNDGKTAASVDLSVTYAPLSQNIRNLARFHAKWHRDAFLPTNPDRWIDWTMLKTEGRGRFCGAALEVYNPEGRWWGEGDEKLWVDGEKFPSSIGTGSEDYFGYAWGSAGLFQRAYHDQTLNERGNAGNISVNRWHISDNVPFQTTFEADIEKYFGNERPTTYACTVYWYQAPGGKDAYGEVPLAKRPAESAAEVYKNIGLIEGESLKVLACTGGTARSQELHESGGTWSGDAHLWWSRAKAGDKLDLAVPVDVGGHYEFIARLTRAADYGIVQLYLDGAKVGEPIDLYTSGVATTRELTLATLDLKAGEHKFTVEVVGANERATKAFMIGFGLDYVKVAPAKP